MPEIAYRAAKPHSPIKYFNNRGKQWQGKHIKKRLQTNKVLQSRGKSTFNFLDIKGRVTNLQYCEVICLCDSIHYDVDTVELHDWPIKNTGQGFALPFCHYIGLSVKTLCICLLGENVKGTSIEHKAVERPTTHPATHGRQSMGGSGLKISNYYYYYYVFLTLDCIYYF